MANKINFQVGYTVDKSGLTEIQNALKQVQQEAASAELSGNLTTELTQAAEAASALSAILNESWNSKLGQLDLTHFNNSIKDSFKSFSELKATMEAGGASGTAAYNKMASSVLSTNLQIRESNKLLNSMATTMGNTVKWGIASSAMNSFTGAVQSAWSYVQKLDTSLNDIRIVTEKSAEDMASFAEYANEAAKSLGASTTDYTNASLIYYQQGLSDEEVQERAEVTLKAANVTGQAASEVSEQLTAVWNGFGITTENAEQAVDVLAAVAASTASDLEELSTGMSKVASAASAMGVGEEQLAAQLSTIISVTRQAPESVGTALKTIYARMSDIEAGVDEEGATLTSYTAEMAELGINVLDSNNKLRDMGDVIEEIGGKWSDMSREQQIALAQTMAGTRQYNNLIALFDNWDDYLDALDVANNATGTLQEQQDIYMESTAAHLQQLQTAGEGVYDSLFDTDAINNIIDGLTKVVELFNNFVDSANAGFGSFKTLGVMVANIFNNQIGKAISRQIDNIQLMRQNQADLQIVQQVANTGMATNSTNSPTDKAMNEAYEGQIKRANELFDVLGTISQEDYNRLANLNKEITELDLELVAYRELANVADTINITEETANLKNQTKELQQQQQIYQILARAKKEGALSDEQSQRLAKIIGEDSEEYKNIVEQTKNDTNGINNLLKEQEKRVLELQQEVDKLNAKLKVAQSYQNGEGEAAREATENERNAKLDAFTNGEKDKDGNLLLGIDSIKQQQTISELTQGLTSLFMIMSSIKSIGSILTNEDLTPFEKFSQIASNLVFTLPMVLNSTKSLQNLGTNLATVFDSAATKINTKANIENAQSRTAVGEAATVESAGIKKSTASQTENSLTKSIDGFKQLGNSIKNTYTAFGNLIMKNSDLGASLGQVTAKFGETASANLVATAALAGIAAAVTVTVIAIRAAVKAYNAQANAAKEAAEAAEEIADANAQVTESYDNLQSVIDTYDSAKEQLDECIKGTEEWQEALEDTTEAAIELLNTISGLQGIDLAELEKEFGDLYDSSTGEFNENVLNAIEEQYSQIVSASNMATAQADYKASTLSAQSNLLNSVRGNTLSQTYDEYGNAYGMTATQIQSVLMENIDQLAGLGSDEFEQALDDLNIDQYVTDFDALQSAVNEYATATNNATISLEAIADVQVTDYLAENYKDYSDAVAEMMSNQLQASMTTLTDSTVEDWENGLNRWTRANDDAYTNILEQLRAAGYDYSAAEGNVVKGTGKNREITFLDESGEEVSLSIEDWAEMRAAFDATEGLAQSATKAAAALDTLEKKTSEGVSEGIEDYITSGNFESMTQEDFDALLEGLEDNGELTTDSVTKYLTDMLDLSEEELVSFFNDENYADSIIEAAENYDEALSSYLDGMFYSTQEAFNNLDLSDEDSGILSASAGKYIADALQDAIIYGTEDTLGELGTFFDDVVPDEELDDFVKAIQDVDDWSSLTTDDLRDLLDDAGLSIGYGEEELQAFIDAMEKTAEATQETSAVLQETYASIHDIIDDLETGDTISADDYTTLAGEIGDAADEYFTMMLDGTYKLTGDAEDFYELVQSQQIEQFTNQINELKDQLSNQQYVQEQIESGKEDSNSYYNYDNLSSQASSDNAKQAMAQLNALSAIGYDEEQLATWLDTLNSGEIDKVNAALEEMSNAISENKEAILDIDSAIEETNATIYTTELAIGESAESYEQLTQYLEDGTISAQAFSKAYQDMWSAERTEDLDADAIEDYANHLQEIAGESSDLSNELTSNEEAAEDLAIQIMDMTDGVEDLADNWEDWSDILKNSSKESEEYSEAITGAKNAMSKLLDIDNEFISEDLILNNMADIEAAANGDAEAIDRLRAAALDDIICNIALNDEDLYTELSASVADLQSQLDEMGPIEVGTTIDALDDSEFINSCNAMIASAGLTADEVTALFSGMGYSVTYATQPQKVTTTIPEYTTYATPEVDTELTLSDGTVVQGYKTTSWTEQTGSRTVEGETEAFAMETSEPGTTVVPQITSITKKATGSSNNYSSKNNGGSSPGSSSGSGSSGSGSSSEDEPDVMDYLEDEIDLYHDINLELEEISTNLSRLQKQESKLTGQKLLDNLNDQLATLNDQIDATNEKISIAEGEAASLRAELSAKGVTFDSDGYITNYASIMESQLAYVNSCIDKYNAMSAEEQDAYKDTLEDIKDDYQDFVDAISDYDTLISETIPGLEDDIQDAMDEQIEIQITKFTMEVEIRLDMEEAEKDWNEFYRKVILGLDDDDILGTAQQNYADILSYYNTAGTGTGTIQTLTKQLNNTLDQLKQIDKTGTSSVYGDNQAQALEDLQTYYTELMSQLEDIENLVDDIEESYLDMIDEAIDAFDNHLEQYEYMNDLLEHDMDIIKLMYGDDAYSQLATYYQKIEDNNNAQLAFLRQRVDYAYEMMQAETDPEAQEKWMEEWEDALSELNDTVESSLDNIVDKYVNTINEIIDELNDKITNGLGLDYVSEEWDLINDKADIYLDSINAMYEVQNLQSKWLDAIDSTDSIAQQQKLNELMEQQLAYLEEKGELTDYDIERAELEYEIALKQIQLQEAQQNSSTMRLRRDSNGNYSYEYTTDEDAIADAQSELLELQNQLYNLDVEQYSNNLNDMYNAYNEFQQKLLELYEDQTLSEEERAAQEALLMEYYGDIINALVEENATIRTNLEDSAFTLLANMYANNSENFMAMTSLNMDSYTNMVDTFKALNAESLDSFNSMTDQQLEWISELTDEQLSFLSNLTDEELNMFQGMTAEQLTACTELTEDQITLLTGMTEDQYSLIKSLTDDQISFLVDLTSAGRDQFANMTDEQRQIFYNFSIGAATDYQSMVNTMLSYLDSLSEDTQEIMFSEIVPGWDSGVQEMIDTFGDNGMTGVCKDALDALSNATEEYEEDLNELASAAGVDLDEIANGYDNVENKIRNIIDAENDVIDVYAKEINEIQSLMSALDSLINKYSSAKSAAESAATAAYNYWQSANASAASAASNSSSSSSGSSYSSSSSSSSGSSSSSSKSSGSTQGNGSVNVGDKVKFNSGWYYYDSYGQTPAGQQHHGEYVYVTNYKTDGRAKPIHISLGSTLGNQDLGWLTKSQISGYDTGGYTGDWNDNSSSDGKGGRLAFLHQKELVLNESDTQNLLNAVSVVSDITGLLNNLNTSMFSNISSLLDSLGSFNFDKNDSNNIIQQDVHIEATFGDSTASEIEMALSNLINSASQYANRKGI